jgi:hypothetical protein
MSQKIKIVHIVTLLELGGAQQTALTILRNLDPDRFDRVLLCGRGGLLDASAQAAGFRVRFVPKLVREIRPWKDLWALLCLYVDSFVRRNRTLCTRIHPRPGFWGGWPLG